jgi:hypothetical protein
MLLYKTLSIDQVLLQSRHKIVHLSRLISSFHIFSSSPLLLLFSFLFFSSLLSSPLLSSPLLPSCLISSSLLFSTLLFSTPLFPSLSSLLFFFSFFLPFFFSYIFLFFFDIFSSPLSPSPLFSLLPYVILSYFLPSNNYMESP